MAQKRRVTKVPEVELTRVRYGRADLGAGDDPRRIADLANAAVGMEVGLGRNFLPPDYFKSLIAPLPPLDLFGTAVQRAQLKVKMPDLSALFRDYKGIAEQLHEALEALKSHLPENWRELESNELSDVVKLMMAEGLCLARAPRIEVVRELTAAGSSEQRTEVLVARRVEIVADVEQVLAEVEHSELALHVETTRLVIAAYADGHTTAAQALAATVVSDLVYGPLGARSFNQARQTFRASNPLQDVGMRELPLYAVGWALAYALERFDDAGPGLNRNKTLHWLGSHYNEANLLMSLLLLAGLIPELELLLGRRERRQLAAVTN